MELAYEKRFSILFPSLIGRLKLTDLIGLLKAGRFPSLIGRLKQCR